LGDQPIVAAAYIGIVVFFFKIIALFIDERKIKYVFLWSYYCFGNSWEKFHDFFIDYVPMYNKFRAVSFTSNFRVMFSRFSNYGITVVLNWIKKCNGKLWRSGTGP
jgi:hypothetical protein